MEAKIKLNEASVEDLENIRGVGRKAAENIVHYREKHGKIGNFDDLRRISGIDENMRRTIEEETLI